MLTHKYSPLLQTPNKEALWPSTVLLPSTLQAEIKDPEGKYIIFTGHLLDEEVTVVSFYAPNSKPTQFLYHLMQVIDKQKRGTLLIGGDSYQVTYPFLVKSLFLLCPGLGNISATTTTTLPTRLLAGS